MSGIECDVKIQNNDAASISRLSLFASPKATELPLTVANDAIRLVPVKGGRLATSSVKHVRQGRPVTWATIQKFREAVQHLIENDTLDAEYAIETSDVIAVAFRFRNIPKVLECAGLIKKTLGDDARVQRSIEVIGPLKDVKPYMIRSACEGRPLNLVPALAIWERVVAVVTEARSTNPEMSSDDRDVLDARITGAPDDILTVSMNGVPRELGPVDYDAESGHFGPQDLEIAADSGHPWQRSEG